MSKRMSKKLSSRWSLKKPLYLEKTDSRYARHAKQLKERGFSDAETWGLDSVICEFVLPRLKRFRQLHICHPVNMTMEEWDAILDQMIFALDWSLNHEDEQYRGLTEKEKEENWSRYEVGIEQFAKYFRDLWW